MGQVFCTHSVVWFLAFLFKSLTLEFYGCILTKSLIITNFVMIFFLNQVKYFIFNVLIIIIHLF